MLGCWEHEWAIPASPVCRGTPVTDSQGLSLLPRFAHVCTGEGCQGWLPLGGLASPQRVMV